jgi:hypothetical protein
MIANGKNSTTTVCYGMKSEVWWRKRSDQLTEVNLKCPSEKVATPALKN